MILADRDVTATQAALTCSTELAAAKAMIAFFPFYAIAFFFRFARTRAMPATGPRVAHMLATRGVGIHRTMHGVPQVFAAGELGEPSDGLHAAREARLAR